MGAPRGQHAGGSGGQRVHRGRFELQNPRTEHAVFGHAGPHPVGHGTEVLAHHDRAGPVRFQGDHRIELVRPVRHVRTVAGVKALGDPVQTLQAHDVIDPQVGGVPEGPPQHTDEVVVAVVPDALGMEGREGPILAAGEEQVGWRSPVRPSHEGPGCPDRVETVGMDADGEIGVERDGRAGGAELLRRHPLRVEVVCEGGLGVRVRRTLQTLRAGRAGRRPGARPVPQPVARGPKAGVGQQLGVGVDPGAERLAAGRPRRQQCLGHGRQDLATQVRDRLVVHQGRLVRRRELAPELVVPEQAARLGRRGQLRQHGRVDEDLVVGEPTHGEIGARVGRRIQESGIEGQGTQHRGAHLLGPVPQLGQVGVAAHAPVLLGPQRIQGEEQAPATVSGGTAGSGDEQRRSLRAGPFHHDPVITGGDRLRPTLVEPEAVAVGLLRPDRANRLHPGDARRQALPPHLAVLQGKGAPHVTRMDPDRATSPRPRRVPRRGVPGRAPARSLPSACRRSARASATSHPEASGAPRAARMATMTASSARCTRPSVPTKEACTP